MCTGLKAKCYPNGELLKCTSRAGISYSWRSILQGVELLKNVLFGELEMVYIQKFGQTHGSQEGVLDDQLPQEDHRS